MKENNSGYVYRYLCNGKVVYVGQTKNELKLRIKQHCKETAFLGLVEIQYIEIPYIADPTIRRRTLLSTEEYYIEKYNPIINVKYSPDSVFEDCVVFAEENEWKTFPPTELVPFISNIEYCPAIGGNLVLQVWLPALEKILKK